MSESARVAYPDDYAAIADLMQLAFAEKVDARGGAMLIATDLFGSLTRDEIVAVLPEFVAQTDNLTLIVGTIDDVPVGYCIGRPQLLNDNTKITRIDHFFVHELARGVGVGEELLNEVEAEARAYGHVGLDATALPGDRHTKNFFETFGMKARSLTVHRAFD